MKKLIQGIVNFRKNSLEEYRNKFSKLAGGQSPDALLIACCDSRVVPNVFASTDPGDLFVLRNVGNLVPPYDPQCVHNTDDSVVAALEISVLSLNVLDIIVCGHSECGAMDAFLKKQFNSKGRALKNWLQHAEPSYAKLQQGVLNDADITEHNRFSQVNVIQQLEHLKTYPYILERIHAGKLRIHGWWFDLSSADIYCYNPQSEKFVLIDEKEADKILALSASLNGQV